MNTVTDAQVRFINSLKDERRWEDTPAMVTQVIDARSAWMRGEFSKRDASLLIHNLGFMPRREVAVPPSADVIPAEATEERSLEGMHRVGETIYKVQRAVHGSGRLYAKEVVTTDTTCGGCETCDGEDVCLKTDVRFEYAAGAMRLLSEATRLTLEEAKAFGALYGACCVCGRTLTDEDSIAAGIGPVCASKF